MNTPSTRPFSNTTPPEVYADIMAVVESLTSGKPLDPVIAQRVRERSGKATEENFKRHGIQNIGVQIIRELRGELPE